MRPDDQPSYSRTAKTFGHHTAGYNYLDGHRSLDQKWLHTDVTRYRAVKREESHIRVRLSGLQAAIAAAEHARRAMGGPNFDLSCMMEANRIHDTPSSNTARKMVPILEERYSAC